MIIETTNDLDVLLKSKRFVSDKNPEIQLIIYDRESDNSILLIDKHINFATLEDIEKVEMAICELKYLVL